MTRPHRFPLLLVLLATLSAAEVATASPEPPPPDAKADRFLLKIRAQLLATPRAEARTGAARFRALCDNWGYPLVVDVAGKSDAYQPSELCADARKREGRE